jgi:hypothetical protein
MCVCVCVFMCVLACMCARAPFSGSKILTCEVLVRQVVAAFINSFFFLSGKGSVILSHMHIVPWVSLGIRLDVRPNYP